MFDRIQAARGQRPCDRVLKNVEYLDVFSGKFRRGDVAIYDGIFVGLGDGLNGIEEIDCSGKTLVPGFIDAHVHLESSLLQPSAFENAVLPLGTTTAICDPHEIANVLGSRGIEYFVNAAQGLNMDLRVMIPSCVPATHLETNGAGKLLASELGKFIGRPKVLGLAEVMNVPGVLNGDPEVHDKLHAFGHGPLDGHAPLLSGKDLSAYLTAGISSCHESSELEEAAEKLRKGMSVWIREGSVAKDLDALAPLLNLGTSMSVGFCTDDRNPLEIQEHGHLDDLLRRSIEMGIDPAVVFRAASYSVANHYSLNKGRNRVGAIAPGYRADAVLLSDVNSLEIVEVFTSGKGVGELSAPKTSKILSENSVHIHPILASDLKGPSGKVNAIQVIPGKIITDAVVTEVGQPGLHHISVVERHGNYMKPANAYVLGFGENFKGAIASSVGHDSHNLISVGKDLESMATALNALQKTGGGFVVANGSEVLALLPLPIAGLMTDAHAEVVVKELQQLREAARLQGCQISDPFLQMAFLSLPVIPKLKLTNLGLVDVGQFKIVPVAL